MIKKQTGTCLNLYNSVSVTVDTEHARHLILQRGPFYIYFFISFSNFSHWGAFFFMKPLTSALCTENSSLHFKVLTCKTQEGKKFLYHLYSFRTYGCPEFLLRMRWRLRWNMLPTQVAHVCLCAGLSPTRRSYWPTHTSSRAVGQKHRMWANSEEWILWNQNFLTYYL